MYIKGIVKWEIFIKSWAIVPKGTSKKKIWLGTYFGSVLTIFMSFSGSVIVLSGLVIDTADSFTGYFRKVYRSLQVRVPHNILKYLSNQKLPQKRSHQSIYL